MGDRVPGEFRYWQNIERPGARRLRRNLRFLFRRDPQLTDDQVRDFAHSYYDADPIAEAYVDEIYLTRGQAFGRAMTDRALADGVDSIPDAPESLRRLFAEVEQPPAWFDEKLCALGARVFRRYGTRMYSLAGAITLHGYGENSVAKPLALTGAYTGESARRRFLETAAFWLDISAEGGLSPGSAGVRTAVRVRLMHVFVRRRLLAHPEWDLEAWGVPISQGDALITLMGGSFVPGFLLRMFGFRTSREEIEALLHFWRYAGYLLGVQPRFYPAGIREALGLMYTSIIKAAHGSSNDAKELAHSYLASYEPKPDDPAWTRLRKRWEHGVQRGYVGMFVPKRTRQALALPPAGLWALHPLAQLPFIFSIETLRKHSTLVDNWIDRRARQQTTRWLQRHLGDRTAAYTAVESFTR